MSEVNDTTASANEGAAAADKPLTPRPPGERPGGTKTPRAAKVVIKTTALEDGSKLEIRGDGSTLQTNPDGSTVEKYSSDSPRSRTVKANGDWLEVGEDGTQVQFVAATGTKVTTKANGGKTTEYSDGMIEEETDRQRIEIRTDGSRLEVDKISGVIVETFEDGTEVKVSYPFVLFFLLKSCVLLCLHHRYEYC